MCNISTGIRPTYSGLNHSYDYYDHYWKGLGDEWLLGSEEEHAQRFRQFPVPRSHAPETMRAMQTTTWPYYRVVTREIDADLARTLNQQLQDGTHPTSKALVPLGLRYQKILGAGSQGVAVLFEMDGDDGATRKIVAKYSTDVGATRADGTQAPTSMSREKELMRVSEGPQDICANVSLQFNFCIDDVLLQARGSNTNRVRSFPAVGWCKTYHTATVPPRLRCY